MVFIISMQGWFASGKDVEISGPGWTNETKRLGAKLMIEVLRKIAAGTDEPQALDMANKEYFTFPKAEDARAFRRKGHRLL